MKTKQWKKAAALMSAGAMTASIFAAPLAVKADDKVTISFSFDQGVGEATQKMVDAYNESQDKVEVQTVILPQDANTVHDDFVNIASPALFPLPSTDSLLNTKIGA